MMLRFAQPKDSKGLAFRKRVRWEKKRSPYFMVKTKETVWTDCLRSSCKMGKHSFNNQSWDLNDNHFIFVV